MRIALAQFNPIVGDIAGNAAAMARLIERRGGGRELVVFAELCVVGYPPRDLLRKDQFIADNLAAVELLACGCQSVAALVGFVRPNPIASGKPFQNCARCWRVDRCGMFTPRRFCRRTTCSTRPAISRPRRRRAA